jgi:hypothetical protein
MTTPNNTPYPENNHVFFSTDPRYEVRINKPKKVIYSILGAFSLLLLIWPGLISEGSLLVRLAGFVGILVFGMGIYVGGIEYYNRRSGGKIRDLATKKFDSRHMDEETLQELFAANDFEALSEAPELDNQPLQLDILEDAEGREFYLQLMKWFSQSDYRGISEVKVVVEPEYSAVREVIKGIKST